MRGLSRSPAAQPAEFQLPAAALCARAAPPPPPPSRVPAGPRRALSPAELTYVAPASTSGFGSSSACGSP